MRTSISISSSAAAASASSSSAFTTEGAEEDKVGDATLHSDPDGLTSHSSGREDQTYVNRREDTNEDENPATEPPADEDETVDGPTMEEVDKDEEVEEDKEAKKEGEQIEIDKVVQEMMKIELKQRKSEGDNEACESGSKHRLMFNIWKVEKDWKGLTKHEVQISPSFDDTDNKLHQERDMMSRRE